MPKQTLELEEQEFFDTLAVDQKFAYLVACRFDDICTTLKHLDLMRALGFHITNNPEEFFHHLNDTLYRTLGIDVEECIERGLDDVIIDAIQNKDRK